MRLLIVALSLSVLSACAFGNKVDYRGALIKMPYYNGFDLKKQVTVAVLDARPDTAPDVVGYQRSLIGIPFPVGTESRSPLAQDLSQSIVSALTRNGVGATSLLVREGTDSGSARRLATPTDGSLGLLLTIRKWISATWFTTSITYDLLLEVLDSRGMVVASTTGTDANVGDESLPTPEFVGAALAGLLNAQEIRAAILGNAGPPQPKRSREAAESGPAAAPNDGRTPTPAPLPSAPTQAAGPSDQPREAEARPANRKPHPGSEPAPTPGTSMPAPVAQPPASPTGPATAAKCSVEQILKLKEMKLTDDQIRAACK